VTEHSLDEVVTSIYEQAEDLCHLHDHSTRIIRPLDIDADAFSGYEESYRAKYQIEPLVRTFLYQHVRNLNQSELSRRLHDGSYVYRRMGLISGLDQQVISYTWRTRFTMEERRAIEEAARKLQELFAEHDIIDVGEPPLDPSDIDVDNGIGEEQIQEAVRNATDLAFEEFSDPRAHNITYELEAFFERQGYLNLARAGVTSLKRRFARLSDRGKVPHGTTHNRTLKKVATPDYQNELDLFTDGMGSCNWQQIRDNILPAFHAGVENLLDEIAGRDRQGIREPVMAAIDITTINYWPSPLKSDDEVEQGETPVEGDHGEVFPREDFPDMVSGYKPSKSKKTERGYKFATLTITAKDTPIVLAVEPVRNYSWWERESRENLETTKKVGIVERLLQQAEQHVDIYKLFADRDFDVKGVRHVLDQRNIQYVTGMKNQADADAENIEEIIEDPVYDTRLEHTWNEYDGELHKMTIAYLPGGEYSLFVMNGWIDPDRAEALTGQYRERWRIENEYKSIKENFLPKAATPDYRNRFMYWIIGVIMYNVWRLTNFQLRDEVDEDLGESPPVPAGEIVEIIGLCLCGEDPGG
jgi:hypothetical protein